MIWSLFLCHFITTIVANEENSRSANFIIRQNKRLASQAVLKIHPSSLVSCNQACLRHSWCTSTNFKESFGENSKASCELSKHELSTIQHDAKLTDQPGNTFTMILEVACRSYPCKNNGTCQSGFTEKGYRCLCPAGWMGTNCEDDIDECDENIHQCNKNAACNNTKGSYSCTCNTGFHGDGYNCTDKCQEIRCGTNATCTNTKGSLRCTCNTGFYGDGYNCTECYTIFDFEDHDLSKWTLTGTAFNNQPTYGDILSAQRGGHFSNHKGDWWIGTFENRLSPSHPFRYQYDSPQGSMTSPGFSITGKFLRFLIGGGCDPSFQDLRAELIIEGQVVLVQTAKRCAEAMTEKSWNVTSYVGKHAQLRLIDHSSGVWGHLNFDHCQACFKLI